MYQTVDVKGSAEIRAQATAKVYLSLFITDTCMCVCVYCMLHAYIHVIIVGQISIPIIPLLTGRESCN